VEVIRMCVMDPYATLMRVSEETYGDKLARESRKALKRGGER